MNESVLTRAPEILPEMLRETKQYGFTMGSELQLGALLRTLVASKTSGEFLEIGTGTGLATSWMLEGMDQNSRLTSIDLDQTTQDVARKYIGEDERIDFLNGDAGDFLLRDTNQYDLIFADTFVGKYSMFDVTVSLLKMGGILVVDDLLPQPNWPEKQQELVDSFFLKLSKRKDLVFAPLLWSSGVVVATRVQ